MYCNKQIVAIGLNVAQLYLGYRIYQKYVHGRRPRDIDLTGKVYIVTGSNTGIGYETAKSLLKNGATVVLACRSVERANEARTKLLEATGTATSKVIVIKLDLCGFDSVKKFVKVNSFFSSVSLNLTLTDHLISFLL